MVRLWKIQLYKMKSCARENAQVENYRSNFIAPMELFLRLKYHSDSHSSGDFFFDSICNEM